MVEKEFFDRKNELKILQEKYAELSPSNMLVLYGRRRVGKTELVKQFLKNIKALHNCLWRSLPAQEKLLAELLMKLRKL